MANPSAIKSQASDLMVKKDSIYWVFACNPKMWAIDKFLERDIALDSWGVRTSDRNKFKPSQLAIIRVGQDKRNKSELDGRPQLEPGIYAICQVLTESYESIGENDGFWYPGSEREPGWPTVDIRYLRTFLDHPLLIKTLRARAPEASRLLLDGFQGASFPISGDDFRAVTELLGVSSNQLPQGVDTPSLSETLQDIEDKYKDASPEVKRRQSWFIERGPAGAKVKSKNGFKCQICESLGRNPHAFMKPNGQPYVEAHHVMPVSKLEKGSLHPANILTVCANHHRQLHYGSVKVVITENDFRLEIEGYSLSIARPTI
jgi:predicted RNA-binding protein with PUA-like domain